jgi:hypothetical protein
MDSVYPKATSSHSLQFAGGIHSHPLYVSVAGPRGTQIRDTSNKSAALFRTALPRLMPTQLIHRDWKLDVSWPRRNCERHNSRKAPSAFHGRVKAVRLSFVAGKRRRDAGLEISENGSHSSRLSGCFTDMRQIVEWKTWPI